MKSTLNRLFQQIVGFGQNLILIYGGIIEKISNERCAYESVDDGSIFYAESLEKK